MVTNGRHHVEISVEQEMKVIVYNLIPKFEKLHNDQQVVKLSTICAFKKLSYLIKKHIRQVLFFLVHWENITKIFCKLFMGPIFLIHLTSLKLINPNIKYICYSNCNPKTQSHSHTQGQSNSWPRRGVILKEPCATLNYNFFHNYVVIVGFGKRGKKEKILHSL